MALKGCFVFKGTWTTCNGTKGCFVFKGTWTTCNGTKGCFVFKGTWTTCNGTKGCFVFKGTWTTCIGMLDVLFPKELWLLVMAGEGDSHTTAPSSGCWTLTTHQLSIGFAGERCTQQLQACWSITSVVTYANSLQHCTHDSDFSQSWCGPKKKKKIKKKKKKKKKIYINLVASQQKHIYMNNHVLCQIHISGLRPSCIT